MTPLRSLRSSALRAASASVSMTSVSRAAFSKARLLMALIPVAALAVGMMVAPVSVAAQGGAAGGSNLSQTAAPPQSEPSDTVVRLPGLEVTAASRIPGGGVVRASEVLDRERLQRLPVSTVTEALRWAAGVDLQARSPAQADLSVRGGSFEQVLVLVDGVPVSDAQTGHFDLDLTLPLEQVERIEIVRGPASSLHGTDAMSGVVNVVTRRPGATTQGQVRVEAGSFDGTLGAFRGQLPIGQRWRVAASVQADRSDGHRPGVDHRARLLHTRLEGEVAGGRLDVQAGWASRDFGADGFYAPQPSYEETRTQTLAVSWSGPVRGIETQARAFQRTHDDDFILRRADPEFYRNVHTSRQWGAELSGRLELGPGISVVSGAQAIRHELTSTNLGERDENRAGAFVELGMEREALTLRAGARLEGREDFGSWLAPSVAAAWQIAPALQARGAIGRAFRTPSFTERWYRDPANVGRADLQPERATTTEVGLDWAAGGGALLRSTVFRREARELIDWARPRTVSVDEPWQTRNVGTARFDGLELQVEGLQAGPVALEAAAVWISVDADDARGLVSKYALRPLTRSLMAGLRLPLPGAVDVSVRLLEQRRRGDLEGRTLADGRISVPVFDGRLWFDLTNAFNVRYPDISGLQAPGRAVRSGLRLPLGGASPSAAVR